MEDIQFINKLQESTSPLIWNLLLLGGSILLGILLKIIFFTMLRLSASKTDILILESFIKHESAPFLYLVPLLTLAVASPLFLFSESSEALWNRSLQIALILAFSWALIRVVKIFEDYVIKHYDLSKADNIRERKIRTQLSYIRRIVIVAILIIALSVILLSFDNVRELGAGLLTSAGIAGIVLGFAAQKTLGNLIAGFQIAFTQPIRIDDVLVVEGEWGRVEEITLTYVVLRIWDQRRLILPINYFIEKPFQNWTRSSADILGTVYLYTDYQVPIEELRKELGNILKSNEKWDGRVNVLQITGATERTIELRALMSAANSSDAWDLRCYVREKLIGLIQERYPLSLPKTRAELQKNPEAGDA